MKKKFKFNNWKKDQTQSAKMLKKQVKKKRVKKLKQLKRSRKSSNHQRGKKSNPKSTFCNTQGTNKPFKTSQQSTSSAFTHPTGVTPPTASTKSTQPAFSTPPHPSPTA